MAIVINSFFIASAVVLAITGQTVKLIPWVKKHLTKWMPLILFGIAFISEWIYLKNFVNAIATGLAVTALAVYGYDLIKPLFEKFKSLVKGEANDK